jgi:LmbE family N-acetylglucosaminyl deacetylase
VIHIYLSPHADDALLSCGGAMHRQVEAGDTVRVITVFAGDPTGADLSPFAVEQHGYWGNPPAPMALRRAEDVAAMVRIGSELCHLDLLDAVYRTAPGGRWPYTDLTSLFGSVDPEDPIAPASLVEQLSLHLAAKVDVILYAPLAVGHHVDHQIVHTAARDFLAGKYRVAFYEDYPYAEEGGATESALSASGGEGWTAHIVSLEPEDVAAKVSALGYYRTQLPVLFGGLEVMPNRMWAFAAHCGPEAGLAERIWWPG